MPERPRCFAQKVPDTFFKPVSQDSPLLQLRNDELRAEFILAMAEVDEKSKLVRSLQSQLDRATRTTASEDSIRLQGELARAEIELRAAMERVGVLQDRVDRLLVRSPMDGIVASFRVRENLYLRPVTRGERLVQVVNPHSEWRLELEVADNRVGHLLRAFRQSGDHTLPMEFVLATAVEEKHRGRVTQIGTRTDESEKHGLILGLTGEIDSPQLQHQHVGAEVHAKIHCGKKSLGYVLFGDVIEFLQRHVFW